jgi:phosphoglycerate kinase
MKLNKINKNIKKISGKRIFLRVDFNIPIKDGKIMEDSKIVAALPTIRFLLRYKAKLIISTHLGQPKGRDKKYSTSIIAKKLNKLLSG